MTYFILTDIEFAIPFVLVICYTLNLWLYGLPLISKEIRHIRLNNRSLVIARFFLFLIGLLIMLFLHTNNSQSLREFGLALPNGSFLYWVASSGMVIFIFSWYFSRKESNYKSFPVFRTKVWDAKNLSLNFISWGAYLLAYEFIFRGYLLFTSLQYFDLLTAIVINIIIYVLVHLPKGLRESIGSIPFGILLCFSTLYTGSIITPFIIHFLVASSNDILSIYNNPEAKVRLTKVL